MDDSAASPNDDGDDDNVELSQLPALMRALTREQQDLVLEAGPIIKKAAYSVSRTQKNIAREDLEQIGRLHACLLAPKFDPSRGATFSTYIFNRVRKAMFQACYSEKRDIIRGRIFARGLAAGEAALRYDLTLEEAVDETPEQSLERQDEGRFALVGAAMVAFISERESPEDEAAIAQEKATVRAALQPLLDALPANDLALVRMTIIDERTVPDVARELGMEKQQAKDRLRAILARMGKGLGWKRPV